MSVSQLRYEAKLTREAIAKSRDYCKRYARTSRYSPRPIMVRADYPTIALADIARPSTKIPSCTFDAAVLSWITKSRNVLIQGPTG